MNTSYLSTPEFISETLHKWAFIEIPVLIFGTYCILFQTPKSMNSVKWPMLNLHCWSILMDIVFSILICPFMIIPAIAGFPIGLFNVIKVPPILQFYLIITLFATVGLSIISIMENRYYLLFAKESWWRHVRYPFLVSNYALVFTFFIPPLFQIPDQSFARDFLKKEFSNIPISRYETSLFVITLDNYYIFCSVFLTGFSIVVQVCVFNFLLLFNMRRISKLGTLSPSTYQLQKKFLISLAIQILSHMAFLLIPALYYEFSILSYYYNQSFNNICVLLISFHGFTSTVVMLFVHEPYRNFCFKVLCVCSPPKRIASVRTHFR
ncbi:CRE-SRH-229 protein [Caenorhabditis remanei]|uniref:CRE-SRH-229 protein n=1 Tax=Caenorhabditis remanei TaxID=31234 RepID=E3LZX5_CAERE|nr:CRE-SRH-229 protein [Caenorhabditis remanei]